MNILAISDLHEEFTYLERLPEVVRNAAVGAVMFTGNILRAEARRAEWERAHAERRSPRINHPEVARERDDDAQSLNRFFRSLNALGVPVFLVPGKHDAPERFFLQAAFNTEMAEPHIHLVHRSFARLDGSYVVAGFGGEITAQTREHEFFLMYPGWEAEFALDFLHHLEQERILLFHTAPAERLENQEGDTGHQMVSHIINTYRPHFAICARTEDQRGKLLIGTTLVVCPGQLRQGDYALLDTKQRQVSFGDLR